MQDRIEAESRLEVLLLPSRTPEANPVEDLWRLLKNQIAANLEQSLDALKAACERFFDRLSPEEALRKAGLTTS
jgi:transposase